MQTNITQIIRWKERKSYINIKLNASRLRGFKDSELKEKDRKESYLNLRLVTVELESGEIERLLTNIPPEYNVNRGHLSYLWSEMDNRNKLQYFKKQVWNRKFHIQYQGKYKTRHLRNSNKNITLALITIAFVTSWLKIKSGKKTKKH